MCKGHISTPYPCTPESDAKNIVSHRTSVQVLKSKQKDFIKVTYPGTKNTFSGKRPTRRGTLSASTSPLARQDTKTPAHTTVEDTALNTQGHRTPGSEGSPRRVGYDLRREWDKLRPVGGRDSTGQPPRPDLPLQTSGGSHSSPPSLYSYLSRLRCPTPVSLTHKSTRHYHRPPPPPYPVTGPGPETSGPPTVKFGHHLSDPEVRLNTACDQQYKGGNLSRRVKTRSPFLLL